MRSKEDKAKEAAVFEKAATKKARKKAAAKILKDEKRDAKMAEKAWKKTGPPEPGAPHQATMKRIMEAQAGLREGDANYDLTQQILAEHAEEHADDRGPDEIVVAGPSTAPVTLTEIQEAQVDLETAEYNYQLIKQVLAEKAEAKRVATQMAIEKATLEGERLSAILPSETTSWYKDTDWGNWFWFWDYYCCGFCKTPQTLDAEREHEKRRAKHPKKGRRLRRGQKVPRFRKIDRPEEWDLPWRLPVQPDPDNPIVPGSEGYTERQLEEIARWREDGTLSMDHEAESIDSWVEYHAVVPLQAYDHIVRMRNAALPPGAKKQKEWKREPTPRGFQYNFPKPWQGRKHYWKRRTDELPRDPDELSSIESDPTSSVNPSVSVSTDSI